MTLSEDSDFVSISEDKNGKRTVFIKAKGNSSNHDNIQYTVYRSDNDYDYYYEYEMVDPDYKDENFTFICHGKSPAKEVVNLNELEINDLETNTEPYTVKCEDVCEINIIMILFDASDELCENGPKFWDCGLDNLDERLSSGNDI